MPIYEYNGKRYNIPEAKAQELTARMPGAKLINEAPYYLADNPSPQPPSMAQINVDAPEVGQTTFDGEIARQTAGKQLGGGISLGQKQSIADIAGDMYGNRELTLPDHKNAAQKQEGFWASGLGDALEKLGAGAVRTIAGFGQVGKQSESTMVPGEKIEGDNIKRSEALQGWFGAANTLSERGDRYGVMIDPETGEARKKTYADLWKEGKPLAAAGEALLTATESAPTSIMAMLPGGLPLIAVTSAGQKYNEIENNPDTKGLPEWKKVLNASFSGALEGLTERLGAKVDLKVFEPVLKKMGEQTVKEILKKGGIGALIQTLTEGGEEVVSQLGGNVVDYATGVTDEYKPFEGVRDSFVYGAAGGAQFGGLTGAGTIYRAVEQHKANVETAKVKNTMRLWESINNKQSQALPALNNEKQQLEAELGDLTTMSFEEVAGSPETTPELVEARRRYDIVSAEYEGVMENLKREVDDFIAPQVQAIQDVAVDGIVTELNAGTEEIPDIVYLVKGDIAINEDGTIDPSGTAPLLTVKNSEGHKRLISRKRIVTAQQDDLNTTIEGIKQRAYEQLVKPVTDKLEGKTHFQNGEQVEYMNAKGETVAGTVTAKQNNTVTVVGIDGKKTETFTEDELAQRLVGETIDDIRTRDVIQVELNGQVYDADVTNIQDGIAELHIPSFPEAAGRYQDVTAAELRIMRVMPQAQVQVDSKTTQETAENAQVTAVETAQSVSKTAETGADSQTTAEQQQAEQAEAEKQVFMQSLPVVESGKNKGQIDQSQMTPEQNIRYFEYQYGQEKAVQAARKMSENLTKRIKKEQEKLDNDPFNIAQNELVEQLQAQMQSYKDYAFARMQEQTERNIAEQSGPSVTQAKQQRATSIQQEEAGRTGTAEPTIKEKWDATDKIEGIEDVITLASGEKIPGRYILTTADAPSPSHDIERNFAKTKGFPTNEQGNTVNDRDYESDKTAQTLVQQRANKYDEQAVQNPVVVSRDGIVISGNDRTMAGKIAARNGTDKAYVDYITKYADRWGFTPEMVASMPAPRIVFVPDVDLPYNTATFAKFNAEDKKTQSTLERAIKSSKSVSREIIIPIAEVVDQFNTLAEFYADSNATQKVLQVLTRNSIVQPNEIPRLMDGEVFSAEGRSFLETLLLGAVLQEQALREVDAMRAVRQSLMRIMPQLARTAALSQYSIIPELNNAIHLLYESKKSGSKVKLHLMQTNVFEASPADVYAETEKLIAIMLENARDTEIRDIFESYNKEAAAIESGQANMFDGVLPKPALLTLILNKYGQQAEVNQQNGSPSQGDGQGEGDRSGQPTGSGSGQQQPKGQQPGSIEAEAAKVDVNPTEAQKEAGNYKKGHVTVSGFDITIENPKGSERSGTDTSGRKWTRTLKSHYGYFKRTQGKDGDQIDVFIGENPESRFVFVVDQLNQDGSFDEHKVMLGYDSFDRAKEAYLENYEEGWQGLGAMTVVEVEDFRKWLDSGSKRIKPFAEYEQIQGTIHETEKGAKSYPKQTISVENNQQEFSSDGVEQPVNQPNDKQVDRQLSDQKENIEPEIVDKKKEQPTANIDKIIRSVSGLTPANQQTWGKSFIGISQAIKIEKDIREFQDAAITGGTIEYNSNLDRHYYEMIDGEEKKINIYKLNGYTVRLGNEYGFNVRDGGYYTEIENPQGEVVKIYEKVYKTDKTVRISYQHPRSIEQNNGQPEIVQKAKEAVENDRKNKPQAQGKSTSTPVERIEDFGEKIGGARKDLAQEYKTKLSEIKEDDIRSKPLSKIFPRLDLKKLVENGDLTQDDALYLNYRYDNIPTKPRDTGGFYQKRKLDNWINDVQKEIKLAYTILSQEKSFGHLDLLKKIKLEENAGYRYYQNGDEIEVTPEQRLMLNDDWMHIKTLKALGFPTSGIKMGNARLQYRVYSGEQYIVKVNNKRSLHKTFEDAVDYLKNELEKPTKRETVFNIYQNRKSGKYFIGKPIQGKEPIQLSEWFDTQKEVTDYFRDNRDEVQAKWDAMSVKPEERRSENRERQGRDWRNGKDVTPEQFQSEFGFRGTEFGNWVNQQERQDALNNAYDALMDLSSVLDISPRALSLNGELGMAFGARGTGNAGGSTAAAHYESAKVVINLTKKSGAGSLAHEWWHALDNYFARMGKKSLDYATDGTKGLDANVREEMKQAFTDIVDAIKKSELPKRSGELDKTRSKPYWATNVEMSARAFENYVIEALSKKGDSNDYLANFKELSDWATVGSFEVDSYPYPTKEESHDINEKFQQFFDTIQEKLDEETGNTLLFRKVDESGFYSTVEDALREIAPNGMPLFRKKDSESREAYAMREWNRAKNAINKLSEKMGLDVEIMETTEGLPKGKAESKGWYDVNSKKITIVMPNHTSSWDAQATLLHEAVGHHGLRELFGEHFDTFLDNVYNNAEEGIKDQIDRIGGDTRKATDEYLSRLAEDQEILQTDRLRGFFNEVRKFFFEMLAKLGFNPGFKLSENELKYILWRSYQNLAEPGRFMSVAAQAEDIAMQHKLKVGDYAEKEVSANVAEEPGSGLPTAITVDGVERSTTNSDGRPIASSEEGIRNFWRWFGDSKVVDAEGRPIVVYHATQSDFNEFKTRKIGTSVDFGTLGSGFYFTTSAENANNYASNLNTNTGKQSGESIMPVYLKINNPYDAQRLREVSGDSKKESENFTNKNKKKGHDGAKFEWRSDFVWYVAFNPNQIKSAIGNTGTFDPGNDDIRYRSDESIQDDLSRSAQERSESYQKAINTFNTSDNIDNRVESAKEIINYYETLFGNSATSYIFRNGKEMLEALDNEGGFVSQALRERILAGSVQGIFSNGRIYIDASTNLNNKELEEVWLHEQNHKANKRMSESDLTIIYYTIGREKLREIFSENITKLRMAPQANEYIAYHAGWLTRTHSIEDISKGNINFGNYPEFLQEIIKNNLNSLKDGTKTDGNNLGRRDGSGDIYNAEREGSMGDVDERQSGERSEQTSLSDTGQSQEEVALSLEKANTLFDNADNLKSVIPKYSGFLNDVLQGSPAKSDIIANAREKGFTSMPKAIEEYLANVEDPAELSRIKELLGVEMPDNALRYMLWRNANPDDGTVVWKAKEVVKTNELDENILFRKGEVPSSIKNDKYEKRIRSRHNRGFRSLMYGIEEGWFDRMASLRILQDAITAGKAVSDKANAYMLENQLTSRNTADIRYYTKNIVDPFVKQIHKVFEQDMNAADEYMNAKHGLERNEKMAEEEAKRKYTKKIAELNKELSDGKIEEDAYNEKMDAINEKIEAYAEKLKKEKDYSGLTAIASERGREDFKAVAQEIIDEVEGRSLKEDIDALWEHVNKSTKWILDKQYNSGIMTKETYEKIRGMYQYYVPLRGFEEITATDLYEYIDNSPSNFEGTVKKAYGRTSKAESPTATIMSMGESGIMQANRNRMKQAFYRLVATNPSNYASIEDVWLVKTADGYEERFPKISPTATGDEVLEAIADFNNEMAELAAEGQAFHGRNNLDVGVKIMKAQASEHVVRVWIAGEEKVIFINGNPRAAQAINGLLQKNLFTEKAGLRHGVEYWSRQMAANFTSRNPAFMVTNLMRDVQFAVVSAAVKEGAPYSSRLAKNVLLVGKTISANVFKDGNKKNAEFQKYWEEFEANGGETGYANLHSIDYNRKYVNKKLREFSDQRDFLKPFRVYVDFMERGNRTIEDMSRFATYVTSRQMGRSIEKSVSDAKEITINFNRKGSGGFGANLIHSFYLFSNPALQSMRLMGMLAKNHRVKFTAMLSISMGAGFMVPMINELLLGLFGDDEDKEKYLNITPWIRRNNLVLYVPGSKEKFVTLMLPHELRAFYGIGEMAFEKANGGLRRDNIVLETAKQMTAMLPIDPMGGPDWWVPDALKPPYQAYVTNRNFMDRPIYRDTQWNKFDPEWTKAYRGTPDLLVEAAKGASDMTGGDDVVPGWVNANPARAYHMFSGYLGGFMTTYTDISMIAFNLLTGREVRQNDVPVVNKLIRTSDEKTEELRVNSEYFYYVDWLREYENKSKGYEKRVQNPEYRDKYIETMRGKDQRMYNYAKGQIALIDQLKDYDEEKANEMKEQFVRTMWEYEDED